MTYLVLFPIPSLYMKKRILFLLALYFMWLPLLAIQKPVFMLYHHALASGCSLIDYLKVITHGLLLDCTIAGYLTALPLLMTLVSVWLPGSFYRKLLKGYFGIMAVLIAAIFSLKCWWFCITAYARGRRAAPLSVSSIPCVFFMNNGKPISRSMREMAWLIADLVR